MVTAEANMGTDYEQAANFSFPKNEQESTGLKERIGKFLLEKWNDEAGNALESEQIDNILPVLQDKAQKVIMHTYFALDKSRVMSFIDKNPIDGVEDVAAIAALVAWPFVRDLAVNYMSKQSA